MNTMWHTICCIVIVTLPIGFLFAAPCKFIYSHGILSSQIKAGAYKNARIIPHNTHQFNYSDAHASFEISQGYGLALDFWRSSIGQEGDVSRLAAAVNQQSEPVVLMGESRGASTIVNLLGSGKVKRDQIAAAVLDSPFDTVKSVLAYQLKQLRLHNMISSEALESLAPYICLNYNAQGMQPLDSVAGIDHEIPIFMVCSAQDTIVPASSSVALYKELLMRGHTKSYLLALEFGKHGWIMQGRQGECYRQALYAFYQKHGIEHDIQTEQEMLPMGYDILDDLCRPTLDQLIELETHGLLNLS